MLLALLLVALQAAPAPQAIRVTLERTACFGTCPVYSVTVTGDGRVSYVGSQNVRVSGTHTWTIDPAAVAALVAEIEKAGFFAMKDDYTGLITDQPTTYTTLTIGARTKRIKDYFGAPKALKEIEERIDEVSGARKYVRKEAIDEALARGDVASVTRLLSEGVDAKARDANGVTLVMKAALSGDPETVRAVLTAGGDPAARDLAGRNAADRVRDMLARDPGNARLAAILRLLTDE
jgi:hypothetical protein